MSADSVAIFTEGTFEEQIQELVNYLARTRPESERASFIQPFEQALQTTGDQKPFDQDENRRRSVLVKVIKEVDGLGDGTDKEIEGFFNLLTAHLFSLYTTDSEELSSLVSSLQNTAASASSEQRSITYRILSNLFNIIPRKSTLRLSVFEDLLKIASENNDLGVLNLVPADVDRWLNEWNITNDQKSELLKSIADSYERVGQTETAYQYILARLASTPTSPSHASSAAVDALASAIKLPTIFDFTSILKSQTVQTLQTHPLLDLLHIFVEKGLADLDAWENTNAATAQTYGLNSAELHRKMRLLLLTSLCLTKVGHDVPYPEIASALQVDVSQVEHWVINGIRAGLLSAKLSQTAQTVHITRASASSFGSDQWKLLEKRLLAWRTGLEGVLDVVSSARQSVVSHDSTRNQISVA